MKHIAYSILLSIILLPLQNCDDFARIKATEYHNMGVAYAEKQEYDKAMEYYRKAIELKPDYAETYLNLGIIHHQRHEYDIAMEYYSKAIELEPKLAMAYNNAGDIYNQKQEYDKAMEYFKKALELKPDLAMAYYNVGNIYYRKQDYDNAMEYYNKALELDSNLAMAYNDIGAIYHSKQELDKAMEYYRKAIKLEPGNAKILYNMNLIKEKGCEQASQDTIAPSSTPRSKVDIMQVVNACMYTLKKVYNDYLEEKPGLTGKVTLKFTIVPKGDITSISIVSSTTGYPVFDEAIKNEVAKWKWKIIAIEGGNVTPTIPFNFTE